MRTLMMLALLLAACDDGGAVSVDAAPADARAADARPTDGASPDGQTPADAGADLDPMTDSAVDTGPDGRPPVDAARDAEARDADPPAPDMDPDAEVEPVDLGRPEVECVDDGECLGFARCVDGVCAPPGASPLSAVIVLNEILIDGAIDVDANDDGDIGALDDEFVELLNIGPEPVSLAGATLVEADILGVPRHTFPPDFTLAPGEAVVLFGGGSPSEALEATPGARVFVINAQDPAFPNGLNLDDGGDTLRLLDIDGDEVFAFAYGDACLGADCPPVAPDQSVTRSPDGIGAFVPHTAAGEALISPGRRADGSAFAD